MVYNMQFIGCVNTTTPDEPIWWQGFERTTVRVETDGNVYFCGRIYEFLGMNTDIASIGDYTRQGFYTPLFVKGGKYSGISLNFKIPYYKSVKVDLIRDDADVGTSCYAWVTVRDTDKINISYGGINIPYGAYLHSHKVIKTIKAGEELTLMNSDKNGMVLSMSLFGKSDTFNFVEGCLRAYVHNNTEPILLSSGFEDYFGFCFGFNLGLQQFAMFGSMLHKMSPSSNEPYRVSGYRNHIDDPLTFTCGGFEITVRNGDQNTGFMNTANAENMAGDGTGNSDTVMGGQITYYEWL